VVFGKLTPKGDCEYMSSQLVQLHKGLAAGLMVNGYSLWIFRYLYTFLVALTEWVA